MQNVDRETVYTAAIVTGALLVLVALRLGFRG